MDSLYPASRMLEVGTGLDRVRLCIAALPATAPGARRRALLIHGNPSYLDHFRATVPGLRAHAEVLAFDQPGFGRSGDFGDSRPDLERSARLALALLDGAGWDSPVDVVGHSHGGLVAIAMAALAPARVATAVLLGTGGTPAHAAYRLLAIPGLDHALWRAGRVLFGTRALTPVSRAVLALAARDSFAPDPVTRAIIDEETAQLVARPDTLRAMARLAKDDPCAKVAEYAGRVRAPVLFVHGSGDALVDVGYARRLFARVRPSSPGSRFVEVPGGHMVHFAHPDRVDPLLHEWLREANR